MASDPSARCALGGRKDRRQYAHIYQYGDPSENDH
jgi:hypothetical protein